MGSIFTDAMWMDDARTMVAATAIDGSCVSIPADPENRDYARLVDDGIDIAEHVADAASMADLLAYAADRRWRAETGGITHGGLMVQTDPASQANVSQAIQSIDLGIVTAPLPWKTASGFLMLSRADLVGIAVAIAAHVQACFAIEAAIAADIDRGGITTLTEIDAHPWPPT